jgi:hypothetical protein
MDWNLIWNIYDALCKVVGQQMVDNMITVVFVIACCAVIMMMLAVAFMVGTLSDLMRIPLRDKSKINEGNRVSLWESLKKYWPKKNKQLIKG